MRWEAVFIFSLSILGSAQIPTWEKQYGKPNRAELAWDIVETRTRGFVICGITLGNFLWDLDGWILKVDDQGDTVWTRQIGSQGLGAGQDFITCVILNDQGELVFTGNRYQFPYSKQVWFLKYDENGNLLSEKRIGGSEEDNGNKIIQNTDGSYMIIGDTQSFGTQRGGKDIWLLKMNSDGDTLWTRTFDLGAVDMGTGIIPFKNNQYILTSVSCTADCGGLFQQGFAAYMVIDSIGNILKTTIFAQGPKNKFLDISPTTDGGAVITGATSLHEKFPSEDIWIVKLNADADTVWSKTIGAFGRYDGGHSIIQSVNGDYYLAAYSQTFQSLQMDYDNWWLLKLNAFGDTLGTRWWGGPLNDDPYSILFTSDGGIIMAGWRDANSNIFVNPSIGNADFYVIKTDANRITSCTEASSNPSCPKLFPNHPNPFNTSTIIRFSLPRRSQIKLNVFDLLGNKVATPIEGELDCGEHSVIFNGEDLPCGLYFYSLQGGTFVETKKFILLK